jgi:hypothetical protein
MGWVNMQPDDDEAAAAMVQRAFPRARIIAGRVYLRLPGVLTQMAEVQEQQQAVVNIVPAPRVSVGQRVWQWLTSWRR